MPRKRLKRNSKGQYKDNDGKAEAIREYIDAMIKCIFRQVSRRFNR